MGDAANPSLPPDSRSRFVARSLKEAARKRSQPVSNQDLTALKQTFGELIEVVRQMNLSGVTLMAGTDIAGPRIPGFSLHDELALLVEAGLSPLQALQTATLIPARFLYKTSEIRSE